MWLALVAGAVAGEIDVRRVGWRGDAYTVVRVHLGGAADLRLYGGGEGGVYVAEAVRAAEGEGRRVVVATNAGMYTKWMTPVGLFVADGVEKAPVLLGSTDGNFGLQPNGVFWVDVAGHAHVTTSEATPSTGLRLATQSGPMLVIGGQLHPAFQLDSPNRLVRSGVGVVDADTVVFVLSRGDVRFHDLATLFRDRLKCADALFLDGTVSVLWTGRGRVPGEQFSGVLTVTMPR